MMRAICLLVLTLEPFDKDKLHLNCTEMSSWLWKGQNINFNGIGSITKYLIGSEFLRTDHQISSFSLSARNPSGTSKLPRGSMLNPLSLSLCQYIYIYCKCLLLLIIYIYCLHRKLRVVTWLVKRGRKILF